VATFISSKSYLEIFTHKSYQILTRFLRFIAQPNSIKRSRSYIYPGIAFRVCVCKSILRMLAVLFTECNYYVTLKDVCTVGNDEFSLPFSLFSTYDLRIALITTAAM